MPLQDVPGFGRCELSGGGTGGTGRTASGARRAASKAVDFTAFCPGINTWLMPINCEDPKLRMASTPDTVYEVQCK